MSDFKQWQNVGKLIKSLAASMEQGKGGKGKPAVWEKSSKGMKGNKADLDGNKKIDIEDLLKILGQYGKKC